VAVPGIIGNPNGALQRVMDSGPSVQLAQGIRVWQLALGSTSVYWSGLGQVGRVGKCSL
jgi:hypothetical protein